MSKQTLGYPCDDHPYYDGTGTRPRTGCARCWMLWLWHSTPVEADARYLASMQRRAGPQVAARPAACL